MLTKINFFYFCLFLLIIYLIPSGYGLPQSFIGDELVFLAAGFSMLAEKTIQADFSFFYLPPLFTYIVAPIYGVVGLIGWLGGWFDSLSEFKNYVLLYRESFLIVNRVISAFFGVSGVWLIYLFARKMWGKRAGWLAALFLGFNFLYLHEAQVGRFWLPATVLLLLGMYAIWQVAEGGNRRWSLVAPIAISLGFGIGYAPIFLLPWWIIAEVYRTKFKFDKYFWWGIGILLGLASFLIWANPVAFRWQFGRTLTRVFNFFGYDPGWVFRASPPDLSFVSNVKSALASLLQINPPLLIIGLLGWGLICKTGKFSVRLLIVIFPIAYFLTFNMVNGESFARFYLPMIPGLVLGAVYFIKMIFRWGITKSWRNFFAGIFVIAIMSFNLIAVALYLPHFYRLDTREQAISWLRNNASHASLIVWNVDGAYLYNSQAGIEYQIKTNPSGLNTRDKYLATLTDDEFVHPRYFVVDSAKVKPEPMLLGQFNNKYYIFSYWNEEEKIPKEELLPNSKIIATFTPSSNRKVVDAPNEPAVGLLNLWHTKRFGPYVEIREVE